jgi:hypothetical protein
MKTEFINKLERIRAACHSDQVLYFLPRITRMPLPIQRFDEPFLPFGKAIIDATRGLVCAYMFDLAAYLALGAAGAIALERTVDYAGNEAITILHGPFATSDFAVLTDESSFGVDAVTLVDSYDIDAYLERRDRGAFVVRKGFPRMLDAPDRAGLYWQDANLFTVRGTQGEVINMQLIGESALYAGHGDDFAEKTRQILEQQRDENPG